MTIQSNCKLTLCSPYRFAARNRLARIATAVAAVALCVTATGCDRGPKRSSSETSRPALPPEGEPGFTEVTASLYAIKSPAPVDVGLMTTPTLNEAWMYGSDFSRGLKVVEANKVALYVSGTASGAGCLSGAPGVAG